MITNIRRFFSKKEHKILTIIILVGIILRFINLPGYINFHYDQGRDAMRVYNMVYHGDFKIVGPETDIPGVFNGPFYYYLLIPLYFFSGFDPNAVAGAFILFNIGGAVLLYIFSKVLFKNERIGLLAAFLWVISYEQGVFARYISNASFMSLTGILFFLGLALKIFKNKSYGLLLSAIGYALAIHANFYLIYLGGFYVIYYLIYHPKLKKKEVIISATTLLALVSNFFLIEVLWKFATTKALLTYFSEQKGHTFEILSHWNLYIDKLHEMIYYSFLSIPSALIVMLIPLLIFVAYRYEKRRKEFIFLLVWVFSNAPLFIFRSGVLTVPVISTTIFGAVTVLVALGIHQLLTVRLKAIGIILIIAILISNMWLYYKAEFKPVDVLSSIPSLLKDAEESIEYTYESSNRQPFSICSISSPLFTNTNLSFLYMIYGKKRYGYYPFWAGQKQIMIETPLPYDTEHVQNRYLIMEPPVGIPWEAVQAVVYGEDNVSRLIEEKNFGGKRVQKRILDLNPDENRDTQGLTPDEANLARGRISADPRYSCYIQYEP